MSCLVAMSESVGYASVGVCVHACLWMSDLPRISLILLNRIEHIALFRPPATSPTGARAQLFFSIEMCIKIILKRSKRLEGKKVHRDLIFIFSWSEHFFDSTCCR